MTFPFAFRIIEVLNIKEYETILDYGAAKGYLVKALRLLYRKAWGIDISQYAIDNAPRDMREYVCCRDSVPMFFGSKWDHIIAKDILEHFSYDEIDAVLDELYFAGKKLFAIIPLGDQGRYILEKNERDVTHHIRASKDWWENRFREAGFRVDAACYEVDGMKEEDIKINRYSNGFFFLRA